MLRARLIERANCLEQVVAMLDYLRAGISYIRTPVGDMMEQMAQQTRFSALGFLPCCAKELHDATPFPEAWSCALRMKRPALAQDDFERLHALGDILGATDVRQQLQSLELYMNLFERSRELAKERCSVHAKMYTTIGVLTGVGIAILML